MTVKEKVKFHLGEVDSFKELPLYNNHIAQPKKENKKKLKIE